MPRSGGVYSLTSGIPVGTNTVASSTVMNNVLDDIAAALTQSIAKDGQTPASADLPMGTNKHTAVGNAVARNQYAAAGQLQDGGLITLSSVTGTDTITAAFSPAIPAYVNGMRCSFKPANTNTGAVTIAINGLSAVAVTKRSAEALVAGDLVASIPATIVYDGTQFILQNPLAAGAGSGIDADTLDGVQLADLIQIASGSFTGTLTGMTGAITVTINYKIAGGICSLMLDDSANHTGTSNSASMALTGAPAAVRPTQQRICYTMCRDAGNFAPAWAAVDASGTINFGLGSSFVGGFSAFSTKGLATGWTMTYPLS